MLVACTTIDCPLNNAVYANYGLYGADGKPFALEDTLTVITRRVDGSDTILLNRSVGKKAFSLPVSYAGDTDRYLLALAQINNATATRADAVVRVVCGIPHYYKGG